MSKLNNMQNENKRIEFKREWNKDVDIEKEVIAFLNTPEGGTIYIGIENNGNVVGVNNPDSIILQLKDRLKNNISPSIMGLFDIVQENINGKPVVKIKIAGGSEKPYFKKKYGMTEKGCYIRNGTAADPMPQDMIDTLFASRTRNTIRRITSPRQDLTFEQLQIYYQETGKPININFRKNLELLTDDGKLNLVGYLLADNNTFSVQVAKYATTTREQLVEKAELGNCSLVKATKSVLEKVDIENRTFVNITYKERIEKRMWHPIALREAIINAFVHADYTLEIPPKFELFPDRIEITSAGGLPQNLTEEEFFEGYSVPRNKELMRVFKDLELVEQLGTGIQRILQYYGKACFKISPNFIRIVFPADKEVVKH
ncbi:MAG TPA: putative DNA binding domain-containing protein, partial [Bacteroidales bacterium]|nr:putative DNA binding domain-containing protein [Bacteroidales bacterium]